MGVYLIITLIIGGVVAVVGIIMSIVGLVEEDGDILATGGLLTAAGLFGPITAPLAVIAIPVLGIMAFLINIDKIEEPDWWWLY